MKKYLIVMMALMFALTTNAQVYDGITQPTRWRVWLPVTTSIHESSNVSVAPFVAYKQDVADWFSVTPVLQYNINKDDFVPQVWLNFNVKKTFYILSRSIYDVNDSKYKHTLSATYKLPAGFMLDATWENLLNGKDFIKGDRLQVLGGFAYKSFVVNAGYSMRNKEGFIANLRWKVTPKDWIQFKYDGGTESVSVNFAIQFD